MVFHWSLRNSKSTQVFMTLLRILVIVRMVDWSITSSIISILPLISNSFSLSSKPFGTIPSVPITTGIIDILMFHSSFSSLARFKYLSIFSLSFIFLSLLFNFDGTNLVQMGLHDTKWFQLFGIYRLHRNVLYFFILRILSVSPDPMHLHLDHSTCLHKVVWKTYTCPCSRSLFFIKKVDVWFGFFV